MHKFNVLLKKDLTSIFRTKKFLIVLLVLISFAILSPISAKLIGFLLNILNEQVGSDFEEVNQLVKILGNASYVESYAQLSGNVAELFIFILIILFGPSIIKEKTKGTYHILKMNGICDRTYVMSHTLSQIIVVSICYIISIMFFIITTYITFGRVFAINWLYSLFCLYLLIMFFVVFINFVSCYSKSTTISMIISFSSYFSLVLVNMFGKIKYFLPFSLNDACNMVLDSSITKENNISIISTVIWISIMLLIMMIYKKNNVKNS